MRRASVFQGVGVVLGALGFAASVILDWQGLAGQDFDWRLGSLGGFILFAGAALWSIIDRNTRIAHLESQHPKPTLNLLFRPAMVCIIEVQNDGESAKFEAQCEFLRGIKLEGVGLPLDKTIVEWTNGDRWADLPRGGNEHLSLSHHQSYSQNGAIVHKVEIFPQTLFRIAGRNSWAPFSFTWVQEGDMPSVDLRVTVITTPSVVGRLVSQCYRIDADGNVSAIR